MSRASAAEIRVRGRGRGMGRGRADGAHETFRMSWGVARVGKRVETEPAGDRRGAREEPAAERRATPGGYRWVGGAMRVHGAGLDGPIRRKVAARGIVCGGRTGCGCEDVNGPRPEEWLWR